jgi:prophage antirepressor-like protein
MDIIETFQNNNAGMHITIRGTHEEPLFRASDIGAILDIAKIRNTMSDFDPTEKIALTMGTPGGPQEVLFLTEKGLYQVLFTSRKPIAKKFKNWVCEVIRELRLNGKYQLEKQIGDINKIKEQNLITNFSKTPILYIGFAEDNVVKPGYTDDIERRLNEHKRDIRQDFTFEYIYESSYNREIERQLYQHPEMKKRRIKKSYPGREEPQTELFNIDSTFTLKDIDKIIREIKNRVESTELDKDKNSEIYKLKAENAELKLKIIDYEEKNIQLGTKIVDLETNSMYNLYSKINYIRKYMIYNFLVDFIAKEIIENGKNGKNENFQIKLTMNEILEKYIFYIKKHKFIDMMYSEDNEKGFITKVFNDISGIKEGFVGKIHAKIFYVGKIAEWLCENVSITPMYLNIYKEFSKYIVFDEYCKILNKEIQDELLKSSYSFLIHLIIKYKTKESDILVINDVITKQEYTKFMLQFDSKIRKITYMFKILENIDGISHKKTRCGAGGNDKRITVLSIALKDTIKWINSNLEIQENFKNKLDI